ncbi:MAG: hypothetical protein POELPBGB_00996 [Bacteroidia bacterium]|nr:hypothetical protein [Bacteroidia bacterium]
MAIKLNPVKHVGQMLNQHIRKNRYYKSALARDLDRRYETIADYLKRPSVQVRILFELCQALNHNFFADIAAQLPPDMPANPTPKDQRIAELEKQVQQLSTERDNLQKVLDILRQK